MQHVSDVSALCEDEHVDGLLRPNDFDECLACMELPRPCVGLWFHGGGSRCSAWMCSACVRDAALTHCRGRPELDDGVRACAIAFLREASCPLCRAEVGVARSSAVSIAAELFPLEPEPWATPRRRTVYFGSGSPDSVLSLLAVLMIVTHETSWEPGSP